MKTIKSVKAIIYNKNETNSFTRRFMSFSHLTYHPFTTREELNAIIDDLKTKYTSKEVIILDSFKGRFVQDCPGSAGMICCNYRLINTGFNCLYNCAYCYLQSYLNSYGIQLFSNMDEVYQQVMDFLDGTDDSKIYRVGTGEFTDSLMIEDNALIGKELIRLFAAKPNVMLELKTKSDIVEPLLQVKEKGSTVIAWSLNTPKNIGAYEEGAANLEARISAAKSAARAGYYVAFHFDPIIIYDGWEDDYGKVIDYLFSEIPVDRVVWISLGGVRFTGAFKQVVRENFPDEHFTADEFFQCSDLKYRYLWKKRKAIYTFMKEKIESYSHMPYIYMCMESAEMWEAVFDRPFKSSEELELDMERHMREKFLIGE